MIKYLASIHAGQIRYSASLTEVRIERVTPKYYMLSGKRDIMGSVFLEGLRVRIGKYVEFDHPADAVKWLIARYDEIITKEEAKIALARETRRLLEVALNPPQGELD